MIDRARADWLAFLALASAWAAAVAGLAVLPLAAAAFATASTSQTPAVATLAGWLGVLAGTVALGYAASSAAVARGLRLDRPWARHGALALAFANLCIPPFGTAHGAYALWLLMATPRRADSGREEIP